MLVSNIRKFKIISYDEEFSTFHFYRLFVMPRMYVLDDKERFHNLVNHVRASYY